MISHTLHTLHTLRTLRTLMLCLPLGVGLPLAIAQAAAQDNDASNQAAMTPDQQVILVTGSTSGLGREVARRLAALGAHVIVHGRNQERGEALVREIEEAGGSARFYAADFASLDQVRALADTILSHYQRLDVIVNNAGIWLNRSDERQLSTDGHELHFAVNYLAGYALTRLLLPRLLESAPARIVNVASGAQRPIDFSDPMLESGYSGGRAYAQSKLAQVMLAIDLAHELDGKDVTVVALHPAPLMDTRMVREAGVRPRSTIDEGADAVMHLITRPDIESGSYYEGMQKARADGQAYDEAARDRLRRLSAELTGIPAR
ncbi:MAG TPA: SDR family NAD(P)-dependent oxidoreductase [Longimicrobiales bacterium]|nr:SDR family NAD(P)-dependent oxidoreductase [Longimicrobiales bacterium]